MSRAGNGAPGRTSSWFAGLGSETSGPGERTPPRIARTWPLGGPRHAGGHRGSVAAGFLGQSRGGHRLRRATEQRRRVEPATGPAARGAGAHAVGCADRPLDFPGAAVTAPIEVSRHREHRIPRLGAANLTSRTGTVGPGATPAATGHARRDRVADGGDAPSYRLVRGPKSGDAGRHPGPGWCRRRTVHAAGTSGSSPTRSRESRRRTASAVASCAGPRSPVCSQPSASVAAAVCSGRACRSPVSRHRPLPISDLAGAPMPRSRPARRAATGRRRPPSVPAARCRRRVRTPRSRPRSRPC